MERFTLQPAPLDKHFVCTDNENGISCIFERGKFNETSEFKRLKELKDVMELARCAREMGDWLRENHYNKIF